MADSKRSVIDSTQLADANHTPDLPVTQSTKVAHADLVDHGFKANKVLAVAENVAARSTNLTEGDVGGRVQHVSRPYFQHSSHTDHDLDDDRDYRTAYELGYRNRPLFDSDTHFEQVEPELRIQWEAVKGQSRLDWAQVKYAAKDAWLCADAYVLDGVE